MMPWKLLEQTNSYLFVWLTGCGAVLGAIAGIVIADYWILRRTRLDGSALYQTHGIFRYTGSWSPMAPVAFAMPVLVNLPRFGHSAMPRLAANITLFWVGFYSYAWFIGIGMRRSSMRC